MKIIVGLGNPGKQYEGTRHNAGRMLVDGLVTLWSLNSHSIVTQLWKSRRGVEVVETEEVVLAKSRDYFMNEAGKIIEDLKYLSMEGELWVAHDDLDLKLGEYKIQFGKGPGVHGGVNDIERVIGKDFWRIRIGADNRGTPRISGEEYVLQKFEEEEVDKLKLVLDEIAKAIAG